jgi:alpha-1,2-mannosyltransferase
VTLIRSKVWPALWPPLVFLCSARLLWDGMTGTVVLPLLHPLGDYRFFDLHVYRAATLAVAAGHALYSMELRHGLGFTYPPFAVMVMAPLRWMTFYHDEVAVTAGNIALVAVTSHAAVRLRQPAAHRARAGWVAAAIALWAEPVLSTIGYGQIDLLIAALVTVDLACGRNSRLGGIGIGLAAALKLTPLIFIPYLLLSRRGGMAARAGATFAASIAVSFIALGRDAASYWGGAVFNLSRVTGREHLAGFSPTDQSLRGTILRLFPQTTHVGLVSEPICLLVGAVGVGLAVASARRGEELQGFLLTAITGLLVSPISWTHHWAIVVPGALVIATTMPRPSTRWLLTLLGVEVVVVSSAIWVAVALDPPGTRLDVAGQLMANAYVLAGLATLGWAGWAQLQRLDAVAAPEALRGQLRRARLRLISESVSGR